MQTVTIAALILALILISICSIGTCILCCPIYLKYKVTQRLFATQKSPQRKEAKKYSRMAGPV